MVLPTTYLGPLSWYRQLPATIEINETFEKQTFRNRCLLRNNIRLTVPVCKVESKQLTRDIQISYQQRWQHQHWMAIRSEYEHTPYFLYYEDYLRPFYERETKYLIDLNSALTETIWNLIQNKPNINYQLSTINYQLSTVNCQLSTINYSSSWSGQIWTDRHAWQNELSILDTLFEKGPETLL
ncbi:MAG: WbqC family protein [Paludibacteraceae bacterium]|nr:WbqC family protein [Paludibacteraceae bacterium]